LFIFFIIVLAVFTNKNGKKECIKVMIVRNKKSVEYPKACIKCVRYVSFILDGCLVNGFFIATSLVQLFKR
jgi:hypothetical protein